MPDLAMDEHGGDPQGLSRRQFLSTGAAGISTAALVPGAPDATAQTGAQTDRPGKDAAINIAFALSMARNWASLELTVATPTWRCSTGIITCIRSRALCFLAEGRRRLTRHASSGCLDLT